MRFAITGAGMITAVGAGRTGSCAALRAGVALPRPLAGVELPDGDGETIAPTGYPTGAAEGFFQTGAWVRLAALALEDLAHHAGLARWPPELLARAALAIVLPEITFERFGWSPAALPHALAAHVCRPLVELVGLPISPDRAIPLASGPCGLARALAMALPDLASGRLERAIVIGADSLLDPLSLAWLLRQGRLKGPDVAAGLMPGEAAVALLLEPERAAGRRGAEVLGVVEAVVEAAAPAPAPRGRPERPRATGHDEDGEATEEGGWAPPPAPALGRALGEAIRRALPAPGPRPWRGDLVLDLNGEIWKASAWGHAQVHLARTLELDASPVHLPAESLGETGAASALVGASLALWNLERDGAEGALVCSLSEDGRVAAIRLGRAVSLAGP